MTRPDRFARAVFRIAAIYGLIVLVPQYFLEAKIGRDTPPPITHPEYFYGFLGVAIAWQIAFLIIAQEPVRYRLMMIPAILEKATFAVAALALFAGDRLTGQMLGAGMIDLLLGTLFVVAFLRTPAAASSTR